MHFKLFLISAATMVNAAHGENPARVELGKAGNYAILAKAGITNTNSGTSSITGDIAVSPIAGTSMTGFGFGLSPLENIVTSDGCKESARVIGGKCAYAPEYKPETAVELTGAVSDMLIAYNYAAAVPVSPIDGVIDYINHNNGELGGETLTAGVYEFGLEVTITGDDPLIFSGSATDIFIIKTTKSVFADTNVELGSFAKAENIFWQVAETVKVGGGVHMKGTLLVWTSVTFNAGSSLDGRILAGTAVTLDQTTIIHPDHITRRRGLRGLQVA